MSRRRNNCNHRIFKSNSRGIREAKKVLKVRGGIVTTAGLKNENLGGLDVFERIFLNRIFRKENRRIKSNTIVVTRTTKLI